MSAYDCGYQAYKDGIDFNPHEDDSSIEACEWAEGWVDANADFKMDGVFYQ
jgi:hypothetical protein